MRALLLSAGLSLSLSVWAVEPSGGLPASGGPPAAVWREQHLEFAYAGRTSRYSCDGLSQKMRLILLELGARSDLKISARGCGSKSPRLHLEFSSPALADAPRKPLRMGDLTAVDARFETFVLTSDAFRNFGSADCELVQEFTNQILPKLATRSLQQDIACVPYQDSAAKPGASHYAVRGEILRSLPRDEQNPGTAPPATR